MSRLAEAHQHSLSFERELVRGNVVENVHASSEDQRTYVLTKALPVVSRAMHSEFPFNR